MPFAPFATPTRLIAAAVLFGTLALPCLAQEPPTGPTPQTTETRPVPVLNYEAGLALSESDRAIHAAAPGAAEPGEHGSHRFAHA